MLDSGQTEPAVQAGLGDPRSPLATCTERRLTLPGDRNDVTRNSGGNAVGMSRILPARTNPTGKESTELGQSQGLTTSTDGYINSQAQRAHPQG